MDIYQNLFAQGTISCFGDFLSDFVKHFPNSAHIRDASTGKYLIVNQSMADFCGLESINDIIGVTQSDFWIVDIAHRRIRLNLDPEISHYEGLSVKVINNIDERVLVEERPIACDLLSLDSHGLIRFDHIIKYPIKNSKKRVTAFLSVFLEHTYQLTLYQLFRCYQDIYTRKKAIRQLLRHLNIEIDHITDDFSRYAK